MGAFTMPALPSLPSVKSLINVSPPLVYPSPDSKKHSRSRATSISGSTAQVIQEQHAASPSWNDRARGRVLKRYGEGDDTPTRRPQVPHSTSLLASPKHDPVDARKWEPLPSRPVMDWRDDTTPHASPSRPPLGSHRRSHSSVPQRHQFSASQPSAPMGRLHEFTRNSLASTSAISLPTLLEGGDGTTEEGSSLLTEESGESTLSPGGVTPISISSPRFSLSSVASSTSSSPAIRARPRKGSRSTIDGTQASSPISPVSLPTLMPPPLIPDNSTPRGEHKRSFSSVPPPQAMRPPPLPAMIRGQRSRRGSESQAAPLSPSRPPFGHRHTSSASTASVSDVAVLATWSFPNSPEKPNPPSFNASTPPAPAAQPSGRLQQRLRSLSTLDTSSPTPEGSPSVRPIALRDRRKSAVEPIVGAVLTPARVDKPGLARASTTVQAPEPRRFPPHLTHRHSHSSPSNIVTSLPIGPSISGSYHTAGGLNSTGVGPSPLRPPLISPPVRHARRPTTSRLRQPNPLCMPIAIPPQIVRNPSAQTLSNMGNTQGTPASSPGSMISDLLSINSEGVSELDKMSSEGHSEADGVSFQSSSTEELGLGSSDNGHDSGANNQGLMVDLEDKPKARQGLSGFRLRSMASTPSLKPTLPSHGPTLRSNKSTLSLRTLAMGRKDGPKENQGRWSFFGSLVGLSKRKNSISDLSTRNETDRRSRAQSMVDSFRAQGEADGRRRGLSMSLHGSSYGFPTALDTLKPYDVDEEEEEKEDYIDGADIF